MEIKYIYIIPLLATVILGLYINGLMLKVLAKPFNIDLKEHFALSIVASFLNLITPFRGGAGFRAVYMKKKYDFDYSKFLATFFGSYIILFSILSTTALILFITLYFKENFINPIAISIFLAMFLACLFIIITNFKFKNPKYKITKNINKIIIGWDKIKKFPKLIPKIIILTIINIIILALINYITFQGLSVQINFAQTLYLSIIATLAVFINITPGSIGITEGLYYFAAVTLNISPEITILVSIIIRALYSIILLSSGPILNYKLLKKIKA